MIALSGACGSEAHAGGNLPEFTDGRYRRRNLPFNGTTADDEVGWNPDLDEKGRASFKDLGLAR